VCVEAQCNPFGRPRWTPSAKRTARTPNFGVFLEEFDPLRHFYWRAEGGGGMEITLDIRAFLAFRQFMTLAEGHVACAMCVCVRAMQSILSNFLLWRAGLR
jgi:hypothetical protein